MTSLPQTGAVFNGPDPTCTEPNPSEAPVPEARNTAVGVPGAVATSPSPGSLLTRAQREALDACEAWLAPWNGPEVYLTKETLRIGREFGGGYLWAGLGNARRFALARLFLGGAQAVVNACDAAKAEHEAKRPARGKSRVWDCASCGKGYDRDRRQRQLCTSCAENYRMEDFA